MKRTCKRCEEEKDLESGFYVCRMYKDTKIYDSSCKICRSKYNYKCSRVHHLKAIKMLYSYYVKGILRRNFDLRDKDFPEEMVSLKRKQLTLKRLIKEGAKGGEYGTINNRDKRTKSTFTRF